MSVFTIFFCGTGSNSFDAHNSNYPNGELVSILASHHTGHEFVDWTIIDGPGSGNLQEDEKWVTPGNHSNTLGKLLGSGWEENVAHGVAMTKGEYEWKRDQLTKQDYEILKKAGIPLEDPKKVPSFFWRKFEYPDRKITPQELQAQKAKIFRKGKLPEVVNIIGWSRGGVSCHMLANALFEDEQLKHIPVNIFAIDPVPGIGNFQPHRTSIPANVNDYIAVYARDERSKGFAPTIPIFSTHKKPIIIPLPGRHGTLVGNAAIDGNSGKQELFSPGKLVRHLAEAYLTAWGTNLDKKLNLSQSQIAQLYGEIVQDEQKYIDMRNQSYTLLKDEKDGERLVIKGVNTKVKFSDIKGEEYLHPEGLQPVNGYLSWHHQQIIQSTS